MQNRLVLTGIPSSVATLPRAREALRDVVEEHGCWVDRFALLHEEKDNDNEGGDDNDVRYCESDQQSQRSIGRNSASLTVIAVAEFHVENIRDEAVKAMDGLTVTLWPCGESSGRSDLPDGEDIFLKECSFTVRACPANQSQARRLLECCPLDTDKEDNCDKKRMTMQKLTISDGTVLSVRSSEESAGTGSYPWRSGLILSKHICVWFESKKILLSTTLGRLCTKELFHDKDILELGAGATGLPSMTIAALCNGSNNGDISVRSIVASDGVDEMVRSLQENITNNGLCDCVTVKHIDWNNLSSGSSLQIDTILFADCIYNEEGAASLCNTIQKMLKPGGSVVGVLPDFRVGLDVFMKTLTESGFKSQLIRREEETQFSKKSCTFSDFVCSGGSGKHYQVFWWKRI